MALHNKYSKEELIRRLDNENFSRRTVSFYRYVRFSEPEALRHTLYRNFEHLNVLGRVYIAGEGINAQVSVPEMNWDDFVACVHSVQGLEGLPLKLAIEDNGKSFYKLIVKVRKKIVADGLDDHAFDVTNVGRHLDPETFHHMLDEEDVVVVDMRNHYESEIGYFKGALRPEADTFREELPLVLEMLKDKKDKKILMYCTGGVRCEKASAYIRHHGFEKVYQLYGGIIEYARLAREKGFESKFRGKNFVFDERLGERITEDILSHCHQCGRPCDTHTNCANDECHLLFIQCGACRDRFNGCCSDRCVEFSALPEEEQKLLRKGKKNPGHHHHGRLRPKPA